MTLLVAPGSSNIANVKSFGAVGNGVADDTAAVVAAVAFLALLGGGTLYFPAGTYKLSAAVVLSSGIWVQGAGVNETTITLATNTTPAIFFYASAASNIAVRDITFNGGAQTDTAVRIQLDTNCTDCTIERCAFTNCKTAIWLSVGGTRIRIADNRFNSVVDYAVRANEGTGNGIWIERNYVANVTSGVASPPAAFIINAANVTVGDNIIAASVDTGIMVAGAANRDVLVERNIVSTTLVGIFAGSGARRTRILGNDVSSASDFGINLHDTTQAKAEAVVAGNLIHDNGKSGIQLEAVQGVAVVGNTILRVGTNTGATNQQRSGIGMQDLSTFSITNVSVVGNTIRDDAGSPTMTYGILLESAVNSAVVVSDNSLAGATIGNLVGLTTKTVASAATTTLPDYDSVFFVSGTTTITTLTASWAGRMVTLIFQGILTLTDGGNLKLAGNFVTTADDTITLVSDGTNWYECARSVN